MAGKITNLKREIIKAKEKKRPLIIVEGIDDRPFYEKIIAKITSDVGNNSRIIAVERFGRGPGCNQIIKQFEELGDWLDEDLINYVRGVIDRDSFYYIADEERVSSRELANGIFELKYYSYESHFITKSNIKSVIYDICCCESTKINNNIIEYIFNEIDKMACNELFYVGMECLRNGLEREYNSVFKYDYDKNEIGDYNKRRYKLANVDKIYLDNLSRQKSLSKDIETIKKIVKGKHFLYSCANQIANLIKELEKMCLNSNDTLVCTYEEECLKVSCAWKNEGNYNASQIYCKLQEKIDLSEVGYIVNEFKKLKFELDNIYIQNMTVNL